MNTKPIIPIIVLIAFLTACSGNTFDEISIEAPAITLSAERVSNYDDSGEWEMWNNVTLPSGSSKAVPWNDLAVTTIPDDIRKDIKKEDGWVILDRIVTVENETPNSNLTGANYILFYNTITGFLKGFYYAETMVPNNNAFWYIESTLPSTIFAIGEKSLPSNSSSPQKISTSNLSSNINMNGFQVGWNGFQVELNYDPNLTPNHKLNISAYTLTSGVLDFAGTHEMESTGVILTTGENPSSILSGDVDIIGNAAKSWVMNNSGEGNNKAIKVTSDILNILQQGGAKSIFETVSKVFNSFFGKNDEATPNMQALKIKNNGTFTASGPTIFSFFRHITPIIGLSIGNHKLGIWCIQNTPTLYTSPAAVLDYREGARYQYTLKRSLDPYNEAAGTVDLLINPDIGGVITSQFISYDLVQIGTTMTPVGSSGQILDLPPNNSYNLIYSGAESYYTYDTYFITGYGASRYFPDCKTTANKPAINLRENRYKCIHDVEVKVKVKMSILFEGKMNTYYYTRTIIPTQEFGIMTARHYLWTQNELIQGGYWP